MGRIFILLSIFLTCPALIQAQKASVSPKAAVENERTKKELIRLTNEVSRASVAHDAAALERLMDEDFVLYGVSGRTFRKKELIARWTSGEPVAGSSSTPGDFRVYLYGRTAVVISTITDIVRDETGERTIRTSAFDVWRKRGGRWRWIASRETLLPE